MRELNMKEMMAVSGGSRIPRDDDAWLWVTTVNGVVTNVEITGGSSGGSGGGYYGGPGNDANETNQYSDLGAGTVLIDLDIDASTSATVEDLSD